MATKANKSGVNSARQTLQSLASVAQEAPRAEKKPEWTLPLDADGQSRATAWVKAKTVLDPIKRHEESVKTEFNEYALRQLAEKLFADQSKPSNPAVVVNKADGSIDHRFVWVCTESVRADLPDLSADNAEAEIIAILISKGLSAANAANLVRQELNLTPTYKIRPINELLTGRFSDTGDWIDASAEEQSAGRKIVNLMLWNGSGSVPDVLTDSERTLAISESPSVTIRPGFVNRVATYCRSVDQILAVLGVFPPKYYPSHVKFAINDSVVNQNQRRISAVAEILGV